MADIAIDPDLSLNASATPQTSLTQRPQPRVDFVLSNRTLVIPDNDNGGSDEGNEGNTRGKKLNLLKCNQCREARKKCLPEGRKWPGEKCERCLRHKPELPCSEPTENNRKRGPSKTGSKATKRSNTGSTLEREPEREESAESADEENASEEASSTPWHRPTRYTLPKPVKQEPSSSVPRKSDDHPAAAYLPLKDKEFRLLRVEFHQKKIVCSLETTSITQHPLPDYETISYFWGGLLQKSTEISLKDSKGKSHGIYIGNNLHNALKHICHPTARRLYWVDALCINHNIPEERSKQVAMKRSIFHHAQNACFWLGDKGKHKEGLAFVQKKMLDLTNIDNLARDITAIDEWEAFVDLLNNTVFSRLWLVQEVIVARNVTLHCGPETAQYDDLVEAMDVFISMRDSISQLFRHCGKSTKQLTDRKMLMAERFIEVSITAWRAANGDKPQRLLTLEKLVSLLSDLTATDPRDRIFSVLAIAKDGLNLDERLMATPTEGPSALEIDYKAEIRTVYRRFVTHVIKESKSLDIICRRWVSSISDDLPTWIRPLQSEPNNNIDVTESSKTNIKPIERPRADNLVGHPDQNSYHASGQKTASCKIDGDTLTACGIRIEEITRLGAFPALEGIIPKEWLDLADAEGGIELENFWRVLVADRGPNGINAPSLYRLAFLYCLQHRTESGNFNTDLIIDLCEKKSYSLIVDFLRRVQSVIWERKLLVFKNGNSLDLGLVPMATKTKDVLCIIYGCSVPVVLRKKETADGQSYYQLIGECYIPKMMDGEALEKGLPVEEFVIR